MRRPPVSGRTYIALCALVGVTPSLWIIGGLVLGKSTGYEEEILFAGLSTLISAVLTYPAGAIGTIVSWAVTVSGWVTPLEAALVAAPIYVGAGYFQWYVLVPRYFRGAQGSELPAPSSPAD